MAGSTKGRKTINTLIENYLQVPLYEFSKQVLELANEKDGSK